MFKLEKTHSRRTRHEPISLRTDYLNIIAIHPDTSAIQMRNMRRFSRLVRSLAKSIMYGCVRACMHPCACAFAPFAPTIGLFGFNEYSAQITARAHGAIESV